MKSLNVSAESSAQFDVGEPSQANLTRANIIAVATREFASKGFSGAREDEIADLTATSKRMITPISTAKRVSMLLWWNMPIAVSAKLRHA